MPNNYTHVDEIDEIISKPPNWFMSWGTAIVFFVTFLCLTMANFIQYPDIVNSEMTIFSQSPTATTSKPKIGQNDLTNTVPQLTGQVRISQKDISLLKLNQEVIIKLYRYPFMEFGVLKGRIQSISDKPSEDLHYRATVNIFSDSKRSKRIHLKPMMQGTAEILTENKNLYQRVMGKIRL
jgi:hypothetical protein